LPEKGRIARRRGKALSVSSATVPRFCAVAAAQLNPTPRAAVHLVNDIRALAEIEYALPKVQQQPACTQNASSDPESRIARK
jgi:hypothetical protein